MSEEIALENQEIRKLFNEHNGAISMHEINEKLSSFQLPIDVRRKILKVADRNKDGYLTYEEFRKYIADDSKGSRREATFLNRALRAAIRSVAPKERVHDYLDHYNCRPPPLFILTISIAQIAVFFYYYFKLKDTPNQVTANSGVDITSPLIYSPYLRQEAWRFLSYMFLHSGYMHLLSNMLFQLLIGLPLEMVHKLWRVGFVYMLGVIAGSLGCSVFDSGTYLVGASGGSYALIGAHFAIVIMNWKEMRFSLDNSFARAFLSAPIRLIFWTILASLDFAGVVYQRYANEASSVSHIAHLMGFITGILVGIPVLKNLVVKTWERRLLWVSAFVYTCFFTLAIVYNFFHTNE